MSGRPVAPLGVAVAGALLFLVLAATTATGLTEPLDQRVRAFFHTPDAWTEWQQRADAFSHLFSPRRLVTASMAVAALLSVLRRSPWPLVFAALLTAGASATVVVAKGVMGNLDTPPSVLHFVGAFPSGHTVAALVFTGQLVLLVRFGPRWLPWLAVLAFGGAMAWAIQLSTMHWATDVLGGIGIAGFWLAFASTWDLRARSLGGDPSAGARDGAEASLESW